MRAQSKRERRLLALLGEKDLALGDLESRFAEARRSYKKLSQVLHEREDQIQQQQVIEAKQQEKIDRMNFVIEQKNIEIAEKEVLENKYSRLIKNEKKMKSILTSLQQQNRNLQKELLIVKENAADKETEPLENTEAETTFPNSFNFIARNHDILRREQVIKHEVLRLEQATNTEDVLFSKENKQLKNNYDHINRTVIGMEKQICFLKKENYILREGTQEVVSKLEALETENAREKVEAKKNLEDVKAGKSNEIKQLKLKLATEIQVLTDENKYIQAKLKCAQKQCEEYEVKVEALIKDLSKEKENISNLTRNQETLHRDSNEANRVIEQLREKYFAERAKRENVQSTSVSAEAYKTAKDTEIRILKEKILYLRQELEREKDEAERALADKSVILEKTSSIVDKERSESALKQSRNLEKLQDLREEYEKVLEWNAKLNEKIKSLEVKVLRATSMNQHLKTELEEKEEQLSNANKIIQNLEEKLEDSASEKNLFERQIKLNFMEKLGMTVKSCEKRRRQVFLLLRGFSCFKKSVTAELLVLKGLFHDAYSMTKYGLQKIQGRRKETAAAIFLAVLKKIRIRLQSRCYTHLHSFMLMKRQERKIEKIQCESRFLCDEDLTVRKIHLLEKINRMIFKHNLQIGVFRCSVFKKFRTLSRNLFQNYFENNFSRLISVLTNVCSKYELRSKVRQLIYEHSSKVQFGLRTHIKIIKKAFELRYQKKYFRESIEKNQELVSLKLRYNEKYRTLMKKSIMGIRDTLQENLRSETERRLNHQKRFMFYRSKLLGDIISKSLNNQLGFLSCSYQKTLREKERKILLAEKNFHEHCDQTKEQNKMLQEDFSIQRNAMRNLILNYFNDTKTKEVAMKSLKSDLLKDREKHKLILFDALSIQKAKLLHQCSLEKICLRKKNHFQLMEKKRVMKQEFNNLLQNLKEEAVASKVKALKFNTKKWQKVIKELTENATKYADDMSDKFLQEKRKLLMDFSSQKQEEIIEAENRFMQRETESLKKLEQKHNKDKENIKRDFISRQKDKLEEERDKFKARAAKVLETEKQNWHLEEKKRKAKLLKLFMNDYKEFKKAFVQIYKRALKLVVSCVSKSLMSVKEHCVSIIQETHESLKRNFMSERKESMALCDISIQNKICSLEQLHANKQTKIRSWACCWAQMSLEDCFGYQQVSFLHKVSSAQALKDKQKALMKLKEMERRNKILNDMVRLRKQQNSANQLRFLLFKVHAVACFSVQRKNLVAEYVKQKEKLMFNHNFNSKNLKNKLLSEKEQKERLEEVLQRLYTILMKFRKNEIIACKGRIEILVDQAKQSHQDLTSLYIHQQELKEQHQQLKNALVSTKSSLNLLGNELYDGKVVQFNPDKIARKKQLDEDFEHCLFKINRVKELEGKCMKQIAESIKKGKQKKEELIRVEKNLSCILVELQQRIFGLLQSFLTGNEESS
eukprot:snap_masked-scaffold_7-processed-gene-16.12-mRNA-1 protein AED:1.00 eAED:1.00 QI:0/-1/0/0/-1/1/1/0/1442